MPSYSTTPLFSIQEVAGGEESRSQSRVHSLVHPSEIYEGQLANSQSFGTLSMASSSKCPPSTDTLKAHLEEFKNTEARYLEELKVLLVVFDSFDPCFDNYFDCSNQDGNPDLIKMRQQQNSDLIKLVSKLLKHHTNLVNGILSSSSSDVGLILLRISEWSLSVHSLYADYVASYRLDLDTAKTEITLRRTPLLEIRKISQLLDSLKRNIYCLDAQPQIRLQDLISNLELSSQRFQRTLDKSYNKDQSERVRVLSNVNFSSVKSFTTLSSVCSHFEAGSLEAIFTSELFYKNDKLNTAVNFQKAELMFLKSSTSTNLALVKIEDQCRSLLFPPFRHGELEFDEEVEPSVLLLKHCLLKKIELYVSITEKDPQRIHEVTTRLKEMFPKKKSDRTSMVLSEPDSFGIMNAVKKSETKGVQKSYRPVAKSMKCLKPSGKENITQQPAKPTLIVNPVTDSWSFATHLKKCRVNISRSVASSVASQSVDSFKLDPETLAKKEEDEPMLDDPIELQESTDPQKDSKTLNDKRYQQVDSKHQSTILSSISNDDLTRNLLRSVIEEDSSSSEVSSVSYSIDMTQPMEEGQHYLSREDVRVKVSTEKDICAPIDTVGAKSPEKQEIIDESAAEQLVSSPQASEAESSHQTKKYKQPAESSASSSSERRSLNTFDPQKFAKTYENAILETTSRKKKLSFFNMLGGIVGRKHDLKRKAVSRGESNSKSSLISSATAMPALSGKQIQSIISSSSQTYLQDVKFLLWKNSRWTRAELVKMKWIHTRSQEKYLVGYLLKGPNKDCVGFLCKFTENTVVKRSGPFAIQIKTVDYTNKSVMLLIRTFSEENALRLLEIFHNERKGEISNSSSQQSDLSFVSQASSQTSVSEVSSNLASLLPPPPKFSLSSLNASASTSSPSTVSSSLLNHTTLSSDDGSYEKVCTDDPSASLKRRDNSRLIYHNVVQLFQFHCDNRLKSFGKAIFRVGDFGSIREKQYLIRNLQVSLDIDLPATAFTLLDEKRVMMDVSKSHQTQGSYVVLFEKALDAEDFWEVIRN
ncbi:hypothetical protein FOA43_001591 [Brettanomyces nanus]|uniref:PH-like domain-containing protein n=1 Tax=Eeniella nana TaxID=13502 RepID=A0A875RYN6_EENNA|nr:uncharacterized protein FOA43_001591 [Brettanomyces nanus]QPG74266.1 hypothetical protein FOA43_001591 [Brettanomyces nanus]